MKSMTGFGKKTIQNENYQLDVEVKSVNQRFLDIQLRMPKELNAYELVIRQVIKRTLKRGRVEVYVNLQKIGNNQKEVRVQWDLIDQLLTSVDQHLKENYPEATFDAGDTVNHLLKQNDFVEIVEAEIADQTFEPFLVQAFEAAIASLDQSRVQEGTQIKQVLLDYVAVLTQSIQELQAFVGVFEQEYRQRFEAKLNEWLGSQVDETRLLTEMAILLEKGDIHEELDRLDIHIDKLHQLLDETEPGGRELDFLIQEMNREVNTIGSKSSPIEIKNSVVQMKTTLEKIREQIQNVE
ncbi:YicC family protein [Enterococcus faecalis]|uniref:YicC/YloC family endoribonuclease n=1 Tax=Enterococcus faecalis TaxID=1351 RepID=UPI0019FD4F41|nr:YicC family protein [Enterococcus faecalis]EHS2034113.1 YicC family protein [Enterococcus faecalis]